MTVIPAKAGIHKKKMKKYYIYILASKKNGTLYIGMTNNLIRRIFEHKEKIIEGFTSKYSINKLVYYEEHSYVNDANIREKQMKEWKREWKINLIESLNKNWEDLYENMVSDEIEKELKEYYSEKTGFRPSPE